MRLIQCILTENDCYKTNQWIKPKGVMLHSTGSNNPTLKRYVQPLETDANYNELISILGYNRNHNDWNRPGTNACVHAFIGKFADGSIGTAQTLPWNMRGWHAGNGTTRPSANNTHISFEICEDDLTDPDYFAKVYKEAVELTAYLCQMYNLNPLQDEVVICHNEGYHLGMASGHADVTHWFPKFGKTMDDFRADVKAQMDEGVEEEVTQEQFDAMMDDWLTRRSLEKPSGWSQSSRQWAEQNGIIKGVGDIDGDGQNDFSYKSFITREETIVMLDRMQNGVQ